MHCMQVQHPVEGSWQIIFPTAVVLQSRGRQGVGLRQTGNLMGFGAGQMLPSVRLCQLPSTGLQPLPLLGTVALLLS